MVASPSSAPSILAHLAPELYLSIPLAPLTRVEINLSGVLPHIGPEIVHFGGIGRIDSIFHLGARDLHG